MHRSSLVVVAALGLFLGIVSLGTQARSDGGKAPTLGELVGKYSYVGTREKDEAEIKAKSDAATAGMSRMERKRAVPRLESSTRIPARVTISQQNGNVVFQMDDYIVTVPENGTAATVTTPLGESANASFDTKTATLLQSVVKTGGQKTNAFRFDEAGQLTMHVRVTNSKLAGPVVFTLRYARAK
ncbi:MAG: hypothetical protein WCE62_06590 [Polyangiales bacterium]